MTEFADRIVGLRAILALCAGLLLQESARAQEASPPLSRIAFGSCARQYDPQPVWDVIVAKHPQLFLFIGDNIYGDTEDMQVLRDKYGQLAAFTGFRKLRQSCPLLATWDDHDYGVNDGGAEYPKRKESQQVFLDFLGVHADSPRRTQDGVYDAQIYGPPGRRAQVILLDTRYFRGPLKKRVPLEKGVGPYVPQTDPTTTMLGEAQWAWLAEQLKQPAEVRIIASSIQIIPEDQGYEKWMNFPHERERLFKLIADTRAAGVIFLSGDRHLAELSMMDGGVGYPLYDLTSSGLNSAARQWRPQEVNRHRVGTMNWGDNFGAVEIDWEREKPLVRLQIYDIEGDLVLQQKIPLVTLQPGVIPVTVK